MGLGHGGTHRDRLSVPRWQQLQAVWAAGAGQSRGRGARSALGGLPASLSGRPAISRCVHFDPAALGWETLFFPGHDPAGDDISLHELAGIRDESYGTAVGGVEDLLHRLKRLDQ